MILFYFPHITNRLLIITLNITLHMSEGVKGGLEGICKLNPFLPSLLKFPEHKIPHHSLFIDIQKKKKKIFLVPFIHLLHVFLIYFTKTTF